MSLAKYMGAEVIGLRPRELITRSSRFRLRYFRLRGTKVAQSN
jgi:hypothetical protein